MFVIILLITATLGDKKGDSGDGAKSTMFYLPDSEETSEP